MKHQQVTCTATAATLVSQSAVLLWHVPVSARENHWWFQINISLCLSHYLRWQLRLSEIWSETTAVCQPGAWQVDRTAGVGARLQKNRRTDSFLCLLELLKALANKRAPTRKLFLNSSGFVLVSYPYTDTPSFIQWFILFPLTWPWTGKSLSTILWL